MKIEDRIKKKDEEYKFLNDCRKQMDMQWEQLSDMFVDREGYKRQIQTQVTRKEINEIKVEISQFTKE